jgi:hypothetical protein
VAIGLSPVKNEARPAIGLPVYIVAAVALIGGGLLYYYFQKGGSVAPEIALTTEARQYLPNLKLADVDMKANESYAGQVVVEITGKISNSGDKNLDTVEIYCIFSDTYWQLVLRKRVPIVSTRMGGLKPGETKSFRLPFDELPDSWNHAMPQLVIAGIKF